MAKEEIKIHAPTFFLVAWNSSEKWRVGIKRPEVLLVTTLWYGKNGSLFQLGTSKWGWNHRCGPFCRVDLRNAIIHCWFIHFYFRVSGPLCLRTRRLGQLVRWLRRKYEFVTFLLDRNMCIFLSCFIFLTEIVGETGLNGALEESVSRLEKGERSKKKVQVGCFEWRDVYERPLHLPSFFFAFILVMKTRCFLTWPRLLRPRINYFVVSRRDFTIIILPGLWRHCVFDEPVAFHKRFKSLGLSGKGWKGESILCFFGIERNGELGI